MTDDKPIEEKPIVWMGSSLKDRSVYAVNIGTSIYVLHLFKKKSKKGIETPKQDMDLIRSRLKLAQEDADEKKK